LLRAISDAWAKGRARTGRSEDKAGEKPVSQIASVWSALDLRRKAIVIAATIAMFAAILGVSRLATTPGMALLYARVEGGAAADVIEALDAQRVVYEVRGDSIYVDAARRDAIRMTLAGQGLPANTGAGYELLDGLSGFGTTSQMFDAAFLRAREGELARTIVASPHIRAARVHIASSEGQPFRARVAPSASVSVTSATGRLTPPQAQAMQHLVAAAVPGMRAEDVTVVDAATGLVLSAETDAPASRMAQDRAAALRASVTRLLEARVGAGNVIVEVNVDTETETESITERRFDPSGRVAISTDTEERSRSAKETGAGGVTVASNLPEGDAAGGGSDESQENTTRERVNYEVSETRREVQRAPGEVRRISVAVLLEGVRSADADGAPTWAPRPEEEIGALRELIESAIGFNAERGDVISIRSLEFNARPEAGALVEQSWLSRLDPMSLAQLAVLALVALALGMFVLRPILTSASRTGPHDAPGAGRPIALPGRTGDARRGDALSGEIDDGPYDAGVLPDLSGQARGQSPGGTAAALSAPATGQAADPVARLRDLIEERRDETVEILRGWMEDRNEEEENA
jgi:flagellar M-ring protein FliF